MTDTGDVVPLPWQSFDELFAADDPAAEVAAVRPEIEAAVTPERLLAPVVHRPQIIGTGGNYADHTTEARQAIQISEPVFLPYLWGAVIGPRESIVIPYPDSKTDYEVELAVVIGRTAKHLTEEDAMEHVFGYTVVNDVSARAVMEREKYQVMLCKSIDTYMPVGPYVVTKDEIPDPYALGIATYLNGEARQKSVTGAMTHRIPRLLTTLTRSVTLHPGDIVSTGTPGGVGFFRTPQEFMRPGDVITAEVEGVGRLTNTVVAGW
ncbi:fumarylacetoacetate hydrolase family protein [Streptomyces sp. NPDC056716]|uniref:fumarylacetoacetate hydrolase family protein n=1 Tax=unclassified Streptomyces TaxID=2593676 RepID=UPI00368871D7